MVKKTPTKRRVGDGTPGPGRPKGQPNKFTLKVKEAIETAFHAVGGADYLKRVAAEDPKVFCTLLGKIIPTEIKGEMTHEGGVTIKVVTGISRAPNE